MPGDRAEIAGSVARRSETARLARPADPNRIVEATIVLRRPVDQEHGAGESPARSAGKTREEIERSLSASASDIAAVTDFIQSAGLTVKEVSPAKRIVRVEGAAARINRAFGIELGYFDAPGGSFLSYAGPLTAPSEIAPKIVAVLGLHQEPIAKPRKPI